MQFTYTKVPTGKRRLSCVHTHCERAIDVMTRDLITPSDIKFIENKLQSKFVRRLGETHYLFKR